MKIIQEKTASWATVAIGLAITVHTSTLMTLRRAKFAICHVNLLSLFFHIHIYFRIMENVTEHICAMNMIHSCMHAFEYFLSLLLKNSETLRREI